MKEETLKAIATIHTPYPQKFGIPRQSGMVEGLLGEIVFLPAYRDVNAVRGLEGFSHIWVLWQFSEAKTDHWSPTVRPPRLGGNRRMGVFATRSPFRPNPIGLSSLRLEGIELSEDRGPVLKVSGADILDRTPIYDIKPYIAFTDSHPDAVSGFAEEHRNDRLKVVFSEEAETSLPPEIKQPLVALLSLDPRPSYQHDPTRVYGMDAAGYGVSFTVEEGVLTVLSIQKKA